VMSRSSSAQDITCGQWSTATGWYCAAAAVTVADAEKLRRLAGM